MKPKTWAEIEQARLHREGRRIALNILCSGAADVEQVGRRCVLLARQHGVESLREMTQRQIAEFVGISEAAVSQRLKKIRDTLF